MVSSLAFTIYLVNALLSCHFSCFTSCHVRAFGGAMHLCFRGCAALRAALSRDWRLILVPFMALCCASRYASS